jgi:hypothetical protein
MFKFFNKFRHELHALYKIECKYFITHIILAAADDSWHLGSLFYHNTKLWCFTS